MAAAAAAEDGWIPVEERRLLAVERDTPEGAPLFDEPPPELFEPEGDALECPFLDEEGEGCPVRPGKPSPFMSPL